MLVLAVLLYQPIFGHLDALPLRQWDETRLAHSALEMYWDGLSIVPTYNGAPEMWSTKPPLMIWAQSICMHLFGPYELAIRLPSAFAALFTCIMLIVFSRKATGDIWMGYLAIIVLITTWGYVDFHGTRTGDYDALLTLFTTSYLLMFFLFLHNNQTKYLYLFFIGLALAGLTKGISAFIFLPMVFGFALYKKQVIPLLKNRHFYAGLSILLVLVGGYYLGREFINPGYLQAVWENELGGRYAGVLDDHSHPFAWYFEKMYHERYTSWFMFLVVAGIVNSFSKDKAKRFLNFYLLFNSIFYLLVISTAQTKLHWYDIPAYPLFAIIIGIFLNDIICRIITSANLNISRPLMAGMIIASIGFKPYYDIFIKTYGRQEESEEMARFYSMGSYMQLALKNKVDLRNATIVHLGYYSAHLWYYARLLNDRGANITIDLNNFENYSTGDTIMIYQEGSQSYFWHNYNFEIIDRYDNIETWVLKEPKQ